MKRTIALLTLGALLVLALVAPTLASSDTGYIFDSQYKVSKDGSAKISHLITAKNGSADKTPEALMISVAGTNVHAISAVLNDDKNLSAVLSDDGASIKIPLPDLSGKDKQWKLVLNYQSDVLKDLGSSKVAQLPALKDIGLNISSQKTVISADLSTGLAVVLPTPAKTDISVGEQLFTYENKTGPVMDSVSLIFGDSVTAVVDVSTELKNDGWWWKTVEMTLPPDTNQQQVILNSLEPSPSNVRLDQDGNIIAQYKLGPKKSINVVAKALIDVKNLGYDLNSDKKIDDINPNLQDLYTASTNKWNGDSLDIQVNPVDPVTKIVQTIYDAVVDNARQNTAIANNLELIGANLDDSSQYTDSLIGELRASGVPAREVLGKLVTDGQFILDIPAQHTWVEAYIPDAGWVMLDPSLAIYSNHYGFSDILHVGLALWGVSDHLPPVVMDTSAVSYSSDPFELPSDEPVLKATKMMIFPGISILDVNVQRPAGVITDNNAIEYDGQVHPLESLAPFQNVSSRTMRFLGKSISSEEVKYGYLDGEILGEEVYTANSTNNYVVVIVEALLLVLGLVLFFFWRRHRKTDKYKPSKDSLIMHDEDEGGEVQEDDLVGSKPLVEDNPPVQPNPIQRPQEPINTPVSPAPHATIDNNGSNGLTYRNSAVDQGTRRNNLVQ